MESLPANLRVGRARASLSQQELAEQAELSSWTITQIEAGKANPSLQTLQSIASVLGISVNELLAPQPTAVAQANSDPATLESVGTPEPPQDLDGPVSSSTRSNGRK